MEALKVLEVEDDTSEISDNGEADKAAIMDSFNGALDEVDLFKAQVLLAIFQRDKLGKNSKLISAEKTKREDVYQGRVGLVVKVGPKAFQDDKDVSFGGKRVHEGDWAFYIPANGTRLMVNGVECRIIEDVHIDGKVTDPYILL